MRTAKRWIFLCLAGLVIGASLLVGGIICKKGMHYWLSSYIGWSWRQLVSPPVNDGPVHVMFLVVDHFEPTKDQNVQPWISRYPLIASRFVDSDGFHPRHTWFVPIEQFRVNEPFVRELSRLCLQGFGEIEMHLHHHDDTGETLRRAIRQGIADLQKYGALKTIDGRTAFGFIHGNWALDNSFEVDGRNRCGVDNELQILKEEGCYADFTFPASGSMAQPNKVNTLYYALDDPLEPKSYKAGIDVEVGKPPSGDLLIFQGLLVVNWRDWRHLIYPAIESGSLHGSNPPMDVRMDQWVDANIHVKGRSDWVFVKVHTHGASPQNWAMFFDQGGFEDMFTYLGENYNNGIDYRLHYVTAREAYNIVKAAEAGMTGNPNQYRDFIIQPYENSRDRDEETSDGPG